MELQYRMQISAHLVTAKDEQKRMVCKARPIFPGVKNMHCTKTLGTLCQRFWPRAVKAAHYFLLSKFEDKIMLRAGGPQIGAIPPPRSCIVKRENGSLLPPARFEFLSGGYHLKGSEPVPHFQCDQNGVIFTTEDPDFLYVPIGSHFPLVLNLLPKRGRS